ncbi:MAG: HAD family hydrolase [Dehalococcoidales bacterium]|nr:HAD family hydrolase [Dehalococcoidales bacterium]
MSEIKVISFDLEGTLTTLDFSHFVWYEGIPLLYSKRHGVGFDEARTIIESRYQEVGDRRINWYDIRYWFDRFKIEGYEKVLDRYAHRVAFYADVVPALSALQNRYRLIVSTNSSREFIPYLLNGIERHFSKVFSSVSDFNLIKCPQFYEKLSRAMGVEVHEIAHVGDSWEFDVVASRAAGLKAFYLDRSQDADLHNALPDLRDLDTKLNGD